MARSRTALVIAAIAVIAVTPFVAVGVAGMIQQSTNPAVLSTEDSASPGMGQHDGHDAPGPDGSDDTSTTSPMPQETDSPVDVAEPDGPGSLLAAAESAPRRSDRDLGAPRGTISPADVLDNAASVGGCLVDYGTTGQCVPSVPPSQAAHVAQMVDAGEDPNSMPHPWSCDELIRYFPDGVKVRQKDSQNLDADGDGMACTAADRAASARTQAPAPSPSSPAPSSPAPSTPSATPSPSATPDTTPSATPGAMPTASASPTPEGASQ